MVVEEFPEFLNWLFVWQGDRPGAFFIFLLLVLAACLFGLFFGYLVAAFRHGPGEAFYVVAKVVAGAGPDWIRTSPRRILGGRFGGQPRLAARRTAVHVGRWQPHCWLVCRVVRIIIQNGRQRIELLLPVTRRCIRLSRTFCGGPSVRLVVGRI